MSIRLAYNNLCRITSNIPKKYFRFQPVSIKEYRILSIPHSKCYHSKTEEYNFMQYHRNKNNVRFGVGENHLDSAKENPNTFGSVSNFKEIVDDFGDIKEKEYLENPPSKSQRLRLKQYAFMVKEHLEHNRLKEAIDILEVRMKEDRVKPGKFIYMLLISGCARAGYTKKAFQLYNRMKQRNLRVVPSVYTSLFNACANCPYPQNGLENANRLREIMVEKGYTPNTLNYNAMIKAYGRCGDIETAYRLADEMIDNNINVTTETFNFLLQACASDSHFGFRHALLTWHKMLRKNIIPDKYSFHTMLRCVRDCSIGDLETMEQALVQIMSQNLKKKAINQLQTFESNRDESREPILSESNISEDITERGAISLDSTELTVLKSVVDEAPNLLCSTPKLGNLVSISEIKTPVDRLLLLGGFSGFLEQMKKAKVTPGIEIFTTLLEVIPPTTAAEKRLISMVRKIGLKADIDFFNILIKKRSLRFDYVGAREVLTMIKTARLHPDIITFGVLALSCQTQDEARDLLKQMREKGIRMNIQILGAMLRQGCASKNVDYVSEILQITLNEKIKPNEEFLKHLDSFNKSSLKFISHQMFQSPNISSFKRSYKNFKNILEAWYEEWNIKNLLLEDAVKKIKERPYDQFKEKQRDGFENNKSETLMKKQKIRKFIRKIKIEDETNEKKLIYDKRE